MQNTPSNIRLSANIGPSFQHELKVANLTHIPLSFDENGVLISSNITTEDLEAIQAVILNHNPDTACPMDYKIERKRAYPKLGDQLDEIMKWIDASSDQTIPTALKQIAKECMDIKQAYPKPE